MKKIYSILAIAAMVAAFACSKDDDKKDDGGKEEPKPEEVVPVEGDSEWSVVGTLLESSWGSGAHGDYVMAKSGDIYVLKNVKLAATDEIKIRKDKAWDDNRGGDFAELGKGFEVTKDGPNVKVGAEGVYDVYYNAAVEQMAVCAKDATPAWTEKPAAAAITIDGDFSDWAALKDGTYAQAQNNPDSPWEGVKEIRCYADPEHVFYYFRYDSETLTELLANSAEVLPLRLCINTDGEFTSGYTSYFLEGYDFIVEGDVAKAGALVGFDGTFYQRIGGWVELAGEGVGLVTGTGAGNEYEIMLDRALFNQYANTSDVPMPMGDTFQTGIRFYFINEAGKWDELSNMPNSSVDEEMGDGYGYLLRVTTQK